MPRMRSFDSEFPLLAGCGLKVIEIRGDGNCLFNALSDQLYGSQNKHAEIRAAVIAELRANAKHYRSYIAISGNQRRNPKRKNVAAQSTSFTFTEATEEEMDAAFETYMGTMSKGGVYGDNIEIMAFAKAFDKDVQVYLREHSYFIRAEDDGLVRPIMHIAYHTWEHYSSVRNIDGPITGLPEVKAKEPSAEDIQAGAAIFKTIHIEEWMLKAISTSLPSLTDEVAIRKALEDAKGNINTAVSKLMDAEYLSSQPSSPGGPHSPGSSSVERDADSDDDDIYGPNKRQYRKIRDVPKFKTEDQEDEIDMKPIPSIEVTSATDEDHNGPSTTTSSRASTASRDIIPAPTPARTQQKQLGPKRVTARERKDLKKAAQKKARKERGKGGVNQQTVKRTSPVTESSIGMKTLYI